MQKKNIHEKANEIYTKKPKSLHFIDFFFLKANKQTISHHSFFFGKANCDFNSYYGPLSGCDIFVVCVKKNNKANENIETYLMSDCVLNNK